MVTQSRTTLCVDEFISAVHECFSRTDIHAAVRDVIIHQRRQTAEERRRRSRSPTVPLMCAKSRQLAHGRGGRGLKPIHEVLLEDGRKYAERRLLHQKNRQARELDDCTFEPAIATTGRGVNSHDKTASPLNNVVDSLAANTCNEHETASKPAMQFYNTYKNENPTPVGSHCSSSAISAPPNAARGSTSQIDLCASSGVHVDSKSASQVSAEEEIATETENNVDMEVSNIAAPHLWMNYGDGDIEEDVLRGSWSLVPAGSATAVVDVPVAELERATSFGEESVIFPSTPKAAPDESVCGAASPIPHEASGRYESFEQLISATGDSAPGPLDKFLPKQPQACETTKSVTHAGSKKQLSLSTAAAAPVPNSVVKRPLPSHVLSTVRAQLKHLKSRRKHKSSRTGQANVS